MLLTALGCDDCRKERDPLTGPSRFPAQLQVEDFAGSKSCAPCHPKIYEAWRSSPHGRAMGRPNSRTVHGAFDGRTIELPKAKARVLQEGTDYFMEVDDGQSPKRSKVELVIASGRQHQVYLTLTDDGQYQFLPLIWSVPWKRWIQISLYRANALDPQHALYWRKADILQQGSCFDCHLSQGHTNITPDGPRPAWVELPVNCESCHGPGKTHIRLHQRGEVSEDQEVYSDLHALSKTEDLKLCGKCHAAKWNMIDAKGDQQHMFATLSDTGLRPDGTQFSTTYQYAGHALSPCYLKGAAGCSSCHAPHRQNARDLSGVSAEGKDSDLQCTVCHRDRMDDKSARRHSRHSAQIRCVDCHMSMSWITDFDETDQRTSDHSISIPRPAESLAYDTPNACVTCHEEDETQDLEWALETLTQQGQKRAIEVRPWVRTIAEARKKGSVTPELVTLLQPAYGEMLNASALDLLASQTPDPSILPKLEPFLKRSAQLRALAFAAIAHHASERVGGAQTWLERGRKDESPFVRLLSFEVTPKQHTLKKSELDAYLEDLLTHSRNPPLRELDQLIHIHLAREAPTDAAALIELRLRYTSKRGPERKKWEKELELLRRTLP